MATAIYASSHDGSPGTLSNRVEGIDLLRGIICIGILALHVFGLHAVGNGWKVAFAVRPGVESFLLLSGFFLPLMLKPPTAGPLSIRRFASRRLLRLAVPYWIAILLAYPVFAIRYYAYYKQLPPLDLIQLAARVFFVSDITGHGHVLGIYWSMNPLFQYYAIYTIVYWLARYAMIRCRVANWPLRLPRAMACFNWLTAALSLLYRCYLGREASATFDPYAWSLPLVAVYIATGSIVYEAMRHRSDAPWAIAYLCIIGTIGAIGFDGRLVWLSLSGAALVFMYSQPAIVRRVRAPWLSYIGARSYSIYLMHPIVLEGLHVAIAATGAHGVSQDPSRLWYEFLAVSFSFLLGSVFYRAIEGPLSGVAKQVPYKS